MKRHWAEAVVVNESIEGGVVQPVVKRQRRSAEEKRRIVGATLVPGASSARGAREHGVNANQVFQWRYEYRKQTSGARSEAKAELRQWCTELVMQIVMAFRIESPACALCDLVLRQARSAVPITGRAHVPALGVGALAIATHG
jgi:transposase-like protein